MKGISIRQLQNPLKAFEVDREIKEVKNALQDLPIFFGKGSPEGVVLANKGSLYLNLLGGANETLFVKESGQGNKTGWIPK